MTIDLDEIEVRHNGAQWCDNCEVFQPCDAACLLVEVRALRDLLMHVFPIDEYVGKHRKKADR